MVKTRFIRSAWWYLEGVMMFIAVTPTTRINKVIMVLTMFIRVIMNSARIVRFISMMNRIIRITTLCNGILLGLLS